MTTIRQRNAVPVVLAALVVMSLLLSACVPGHTLRPGSPVGRWVDADDHQTHLTLEEDGTALGNDGCNSIGGQWELVGGTVVLGDMLTTLMACPGDDYWLSGVAGAIVVEDVLHVLDAEGNEIGVLSREMTD